MLAHHVAPHQVARAGAKAAFHMRNPGQGRGGHTIAHELKATSRKAECNARLVLRFHRNLGQARPLVL
jgi:hypothetical protein